MLQNSVIRLRSGKIRKLAALMALGGNSRNMLLETESINQSVSQASKQAIIQTINLPINLSVT